MTHLSKKELIEANLRMSQQIADMLAGSGTEKDFIIRDLNKQLQDALEENRRLQTAATYNAIRTWLAKLPPPRLWDDSQIEPHQINKRNPSDQRWGHLRNRLANEFTRRFNEGAFRSEDSGHRFIEERAS